MVRRAGIDWLHASIGRQQKQQRDRHLSTRSTRGLSEAVPSGTSRSRQDQPAVWRAGHGVERMESFGNVDGSTFRIICGSLYGLAGIWVDGD